MIDRGLPIPELQYWICDREGDWWRVDFAWPEARLAAEYDSIEWHAGRNEMLRDKAKWVKLLEVGWQVIPIVVSDVRNEPNRLVYRINGHLNRARLAG